MFIFQKTHGDIILFIWGLNNDYIIWLIICENYLFKQQCGHSKVMNMKDDFQVKFYESWAYEINDHDLNHHIVELKNNVSLEIWCRLMLNHNKNSVSTSTNHNKNSVSTHTNHNKNFIFKEKSLKVKRGMSIKPLVLNSC